MSFSLQVDYTDVGGCLASGGQFRSGDFGHPVCKDKQDEGGVEFSGIAWAVQVGVG